MNDTFMKTKPVFPLLVSMALPNVISMLVNSLYNIVDSLFVAQINEQAMTALSLVFPIQNFVNAVAIGFGIGINALVALYRGAGDYDRADAAATHGMALSVLHGILCTLAATAIMPGFLARFTADGTIVSMGVTYSTIVFLFATVNMASLAFEKLFQAVGRMKLTMTALISGCVCNILLDPVLIFGLGPVPAMGIAGAALATGIGQAATLVIYLVVYSTTESPVHLRRKALRPDLSLEGRLYAIGVPAILNLALPSLLVTFLNGLLAAFSESYVVVLGIYYKLQTFLYLPANGIVQGMRPLIGYNYGAKEHARVAKLYQLTLGMSAVIMAAGTVICMAASAPLIGLFSSNPETIAIGQTALRIICLGFVVSAVSTTSSGALEGLGKGAASLVISLCRYVIRGAARVLPENGGAALRADHGVRRILQHQNGVRHGDRERAAGTAFTDDRRDNRNRDMRELYEIPADRLGLPVLLSVNARVSARGINKRDDRETELLGKLHQAKRLPVPFGVCHAEVAVRTALDVTALLMPDHHHGVTAKTRETADNRRIITVAAVAVQLIEIGEHHPDVVERIRAVRVAGHLGNLPRGQC